MQSQRGLLACGRGKWKWLAIHSKSPLKAMTWHAQSAVQPTNATTLHAMHFIHTQKNNNPEVRCRATSASRVYPLKLRVFSLLTPETTWELKRRRGWDHNGNLNGPRTTPAVVAFSGVGFLAWFDFVQAATPQNACILLQLSCSCRAWGQKCWRNGRKRVPI